MSELVEKIATLDPRWIYVVTLILAAYPLINAVGWPLYTAHEVRLSFDFVEGLPEGSTVCISVNMRPVEFDANGQLFKDWFHHCMERNLKVVVIAFKTPADTAWVISRFEEAEKKDWMKDKVYGTDYIFVGYLVGGAVSYEELMVDFKKEAVSDYFYGKPLEEWPITKNINVFPDFDAWLFLEASEPKPEVAYICIPSKLKNPDIIRIFCGGMAALTSSRIYYLSGDLDSYLIGATQWAAYEKLMIGKGYGHWGNALGIMDSMQHFHMLLLAMIVIGNLAYFLERAKGVS